MPKSHHKIQRCDGDVVAALSELQAFISICRQPAVQEEGGELIELRPGSFVVEARAGRLWVEAWDAENTLSRRVLAIEERKPGCLRCSVHRFGARTPGHLILLDLHRPSTAPKLVAGRRLRFRELFRAMLSRQMPGYEVRTVSTGLDLQHSFSARFARAKLARGVHQIAAVACAETSEESEMLTTALLWFDYLRAHLPEGGQISLVLFLPHGGGRLTAQRLRWLSGVPLDARIFLYNEHGSAGEVDLGDLGNLETAVLRPDQLAAPVMATAPELELERAVRAHLQTIDPVLRTHPVYGQVLTFVAGDRTAIDLLATDATGRLCVIELKASEDLHLPLQALDYWMRIDAHARAGDLQFLYPDLRLSGARPRLCLLAPAQQFHPANTTVLRYFSPEIEVERVGVNSDWRRRLTVVVRLARSDVPMSHQDERHGDPRPFQYS